jgi:hypothetical protein
MPDEAQAPEIPDTPIEEAPQGDTPPPVVDYETRYNNLRPEFDRKSQQLREYEERLAAYEQSQQPEPEYDDDEYDYEDTVARQEIAQLKALLAQRDQETQTKLEAEREAAFINTEIKLLEKEQEEQFSDDEWNTIGIIAERFRNEEGEPDIARAYEQLFGKIVKPRREKYVSTKKASRPRSGSPAAQSIDLDDRDTRRDYMTQKLMELEGDND